MHTFLSEQEKDKNCHVTTFEMIALLFFCQYSAGLKLFSERTKANNKICFFQSVCVHVCNPLHVHVHTVLQKVWIPWMHTCKGSISSLGCREAFWHNLAVGRLLKGRCFLGRERYFVRTNIYLKGTILLQEAALYKVLLE